MFRCRHSRVLLRDRVRMGQAQGFFRPNRQIVECGRTASPYGSRDAIVIGDPARLREKYFGTAAEVY